MPKKSFRKRLEAEGRKNVPENETYRKMFQDEKLQRHLCLRKTLQYMHQAAELFFPSLFNNAYSFARQGTMNTINASLRNAVIPSSDTVAVDAEDTSFSLLENEIPAFAEAELERLYGSIYASMKQWRASGALDESIDTYVEYRGGKIKNLYLFHRENGEARVLNEGIVVGDEDVQRFARHLFERYSDIDIITFHAVQSTIRQPGYVHHGYHCLEDIVLTMPTTGDAYLASLGSATRSYIKRYLNKLKRSFPSFKHEVILNEEISEKDIGDLVAFNKARMEGKGKVQGIDTQELRRIILLAKECGMLSLFRIDGRICAGTINFRAGDNYFLEVIAHDPAYNEYRLGTLCCYLTICECIARAGKEYHFLWGPHDYKFRLLGVQRELDHLTIYRSRRHVLLHPRMAWRNWQLACKRQSRLRLQALLQRDDIRGRALNRLVGWLRR